MCTILNIFCPRPLVPKANKISCSAGISHHFQTTIYKRLEGHACEAVINTLKFLLYKTMIKNGWKLIIMQCMCLSELSQSCSLQRSRSNVLWWTCHLCNIAGKSEPTVDTAIITPLCLLHFCSSILLIFVWFGFTLFTCCCIIYTILLRKLIISC